MSQMSLTGEAGGYAPNSGASSYDEIRPLSVRMRESIRAQLDVLAQLNDRSVTEETRLALEHWVERAKTDPSLKERADRVRADVERREARLAHLRTRLLAQHPVALLSRGAERARSLRDRLGASTRNGVERRASRLAELARTLNAVSPLATLERGYAILLEGEPARVVRSAASVSTGSMLRARLADGERVLRVED